MCAIAGFYRANADFTKKEIYKSKISAIKNSLIHRGPDDSNIYCSKSACLAHTRLSVRDLRGSSQPMTGYFRNHKATIVYNGEIYNTTELKNLLLEYDINFSTTGDTEVLLFGYLVFGTSFFEKINGIFAFAIFDESLNEIIIARDPVGIKPLFFTFYDDNFIFASEPKGIFAYGVKPCVSLDSFREIFALGPAHTPGNAVFSNVFELLPGHFMSSKTFSQTAFFKLTADEHTDSYEKTVEKTSFLITDSIKRQMVSDTPVCTFLSGGLDSSLVSAVAADLLKSENKTLSTFSFDFHKNNQNFIPNSYQSSLDRPFADIMAKHIKSRHTHLFCDNITLFDYLYKAVDARDIPCMADIESSLLYFCKLVSSSFKVCLTGECADEIFGGYPWFHQKNLFDLNTFPWSFDMKTRGALLNDDFLNVLNLSEYSERAYKNAINCTPSLYYEKGDDLKRRQISWLNITYFMATLINRLDRTSMFCGLEARVPFADIRILKYVYNIPWKYKCHNNVSKSLLVEAAKPYLPDSVLYRKKSPYPKTYDPGYEAILKGKLLEIISDSSSPVCSIIDKNKTKKFLQAKSDYGCPWYGQLMSGPQMLAYIIQTNYWMKKFNISV